jgi:PAP_fibrillin
VIIAKTSLLEVIAYSNRGLLSTETEKQTILAAIATLEESNPTAFPTSASSLLDGNWRLIYTTSKSLLNIERIPLCKLGQIYQCIRVNTNRIYNLAEIYGLPYLEGLVGVVAQYQAIDHHRIEVKFERSIIGLQRLINYNSPDYFIQRIETGQKLSAIDFGINTNEQQGWLDITYIDNNLRISRGNEGSVFVLTKA